MNIFIDTEFTDLLAPELLSLGMVTDHGAEFYAELDLKSDVGKARFASSSDFVREVVFDMWGRIDGAACGHQELASRAARWLTQCAAKAGGPIAVAFDYGADWSLLQAALAEVGAWQQLAPVIRGANVSSLTETIEGEIGAEAALGEIAHRGLLRHHALADARALRGAYQYYMAMTRRSQRASVTRQLRDAQKREEGEL